jgi:hypothetical protein
MGNFEVEASQTACESSGQVVFLMVVSPWLLLPERSEQCEWCRHFVISMHAMVSVIEIFEFEAHATQIVVRRLVVALNPLALACGGHF